MIPHVLCDNLVKMMAFPIIVSFSLLMLVLHPKELVIHSVNIYYRGPLWEEAILKFPQSTPNSKGEWMGMLRSLWGGGCGGEREEGVCVEISPVLFKSFPQIKKIPLYNTSTSF